MKNKISLSDGTELVVNCYKMYSPLMRIFKKMDGVYAQITVDKNNAKELKNDFIESIDDEDNFYRKLPGSHPIGYVIQVVMPSATISNYSYVYYGASVKSSLDKWDRKKGLAVAYADLMKYLVLTKGERRQIAEIVGLCN